MGLEVAQAEFRIRRDVAEFCCSPHEILEAFPMPVVSDGVGQAADEGEFHGGKVEGEEGFHGASPFQEEGFLHPGAPGQAQ